MHEDFLRKRHHPGKDTKTNQSQEIVVDAAPMPPHDVQIKYIETSTAYVRSTQFIPSHSPKKQGYPLFLLREPSQRHWACLQALLGNVLPHELRQL